MTTTLTALGACSRCHTRLLGSDAGPFCPRCQTLAAEVPPRRTRAVSVGLAEPIRGIQAVTFCLPLPPTACSPNEESSRHWRHRADGRKEYAAECGLSIPTLLVHQRFAKARITSTFYLAPSPGRYHPRDEQNAIASLKALVDLFVKAGWIPDDSARYLEWGTVELLSTAKEHQGRAEVLVTLESLPT